MDEMAALLGPASSQVWAYIISNNLELTLRDVERMCSLNSKFKEICRDGRVWERILEKELERSPPYFRNTSQLLLEKDYPAKTIVFMIRVFRLSPTIEYASENQLQWIFKDSSLRNDFKMYYSTFDRKDRDFWKKPAKYGYVQLETKFKSDKYVTLENLSEIMLEPFDALEDIWQKSRDDEDEDFTGSAYYDMSQTVPFFVSLSLVWKSLYWFATNGYTLKAEPDYGRLNCTVCSAIAVKQCASGCGTPYCGQACADAHYEEHLKFCSSQSIKRD